MDKPSFEVRPHNGAAAFRIWANGRIEGFPEECIIINRIPQHAAEEVMADRARSGRGDDR